MVGSVRYLAGGILGLCRLLTEHGEAIEYELIKLGLRRDWLGTEHLSWRDLLVIVHQSPVGSTLDRATRGEPAAFGPTDHLLAAVINILQGMSWQLGNDAKAPKPKPFVLPGQEDDSTMHKGAGRTIEEVNAILGWNV